MSQMLGYFPGEKWSGIRKKETVSLPVRGVIFLFLLKMKEFVKFMRSKKLENHSV